MSVIYSVTLPQDDTGDNGQSYRNYCPLTSGSLGQVRATFKSNTSAQLIADHCSIGIWDGAGTNVGGTTTVPLELLFNNGGHGFNINSSTITSDWVNLSFLSTDVLIVVIDIGSAGNPAFNTSAPANNNVYRTTGATFNVQSPAGDSFFTNRNIGVLSIETQAAASPTVLFSQICM